MTPKAAEKTEDLAPSKRAEVRTESPASPNSAVISRKPRRTSLRPRDVVKLQRSVGNTAVAGLIQPKTVQRAPAETEVRDELAPNPAPAGPSHAPATPPPDPNETSPNTGARRSQESPNPLAGPRDPNQDSPNGHQPGNLLDVVTQPRSPNGEREGVGPNGAQEDEGAGPNGAQAPAALIEDADPSRESAPDAPGGLESPNGHLPAAPGAPAKPATPGPGGAQAPGLKPGQGPAAADAQKTGPKPPEAPVEIPPEQHPGFVKTKSKARKTGKQERKHEPSTAKVAQAEGAAQGPSNEVDAAAEAGHVEKLERAEAKPFDKAAFIEAVKKAIDESTPENLEEIEEFKESGEAEKVKGKVTGLVKGGKEDSEKDIESTKDAPPDKSGLEAKKVTPLPPEDPGEAPKKIGASQAIPVPRGPEQTNLDYGKHEVSNMMAEDKITDEQLKKGNEPSFNEALDAKKEAATHADTAPKEFKQEEAALLKKAKGDVEGKSKSVLKGMHADKSQAFEKVGSGKEDQQSKDEQKRAEIATNIQTMFNETKTKVSTILEKLDGEVEQAFDDGEKIARQKFENHVDRRMSAYKADRYSGWTGDLAWAKDKLFDMPDEVNIFYVEGKNLYLTEMDQVISDVADLIEMRLNDAKTAVGEGRTKVAEYVKQLPENLQEFANEAKENYDEQFDALNEEIQSKEGELVQTLKEKYVESRTAVDERIKALQEENKGLVSKAVDAVKAIINTIRKLKNLLLGILAKAAQAITAIISDPIGFLKNLLTGIVGGLKRFLGNLGENLKEALFGWLFGSLSAAGIQMPESLTDIKGILKLVTGVIGLTWESIRGKFVKKIDDETKEPGSGEEILGTAEKSEGLIQVFKKDGISGAWEYIKAKLMEKTQDLYEMVIGKIKSFVMEKVLRKGLEMLMALATPVGAFIKAVMMIVDLISWLINNADRIAALFNAILDTIIAVSKGAAGGIAEMIEKTLKQFLPVLIGGFAAIVGLGDITGTIKKIITAVQKPVTWAVNKLAGPAIKPFVKMWKAAKGLIKSGKKKLGEVYEAGKDKLKAGGRWIAEKFGLMKVSEEFSTEEETHTVTGIADEQTLKVTVASTPKDLLVVIDDAIKANPAEAGTLGALKTEYDTVKTDHSDARDEHSKAKNATEARKAKKAKDKLKKTLWKLIKKASKALGGLKKGKDAEASALKEKVIEALKDLQGAKLYGPGPNMKRWVVADTEQHAYGAERHRQITKLGEDDGCHTNKAHTKTIWESGMWTPDHQPPWAIWVLQTKGSISTRNLMKELLQEAGLPVYNQLRLYPQCGRENETQARLVSSITGPFNQLAAIKKTKGWSK